MQKKLIITSSPHIRDGISTRRIMQEVCLALAPAGIAGIILFGVSAAKLIAASVISCILAEYLYCKLTNQKVTCGDWSCVVTGLLLAYNLPASCPIWLPIVGGVIAMVLVKGIFGGLGSNFMNPALTARSYTAGKRMAVVVTNTGEKRQKGRIEVPGYELRESRSIGRPQCAGNLLELGTHELVVLVFEKK